MSDPTAQEPTMEEILASIRRIISEDDAPAETAAAPAPAPEPAPVAAAPEPEPFQSAALMDETPSVQEPEAVEEDILELTDTYEAPAVESIGDLDVSSPEPEAPTAWTAPAPTPDYDALVGESAAASAASAFAGLHASLKPATAAPAAPTGDLSFLSGSTVEGMVAEMLKPLLKGWLDANLPGIVERAVKAEVERISRTAG
ncbi:MAG: DUF2497 domain-containing protein [Caulobacteraceae bacterium]|nr:DUF2497 domain-containing protein [Caulobacteraceae bacterium]